MFERHSEAAVLPSMDAILWRDGSHCSLNDCVLRPVENLFFFEGGLRVVQGNLRRGALKVSAVAPEPQVIEALVRVLKIKSLLGSAFRHHTQRSE